MSLAVLKTAQWKPAVLQKMLRHPRIGTILTTLSEGCVSGYGSLAYRSHDPQSCRELRPPQIDTLPTTTLERREPRFLHTGKVLIGGVHEVFSSDRFDAVLHLGGFVATTTYT
jgi:hypothetical protein